MSSDTLKKNTAPTTASSARERSARRTMWLSTLLIATAFPVVEAIAGALDSLVLTWLRFAMAVGVMGPIVRLKYGAEARPAWGSFWRYGLLSAPLAGFFWLFFASLRETSSVSAAAVFTLAPLMTPVGSRLIEGERATRGRIGGLLLGMVGAIWVIFRGDPARLASLTFNRGDLWLLCGTGLMSLYAVLTRRLHRGEPMAVMTLWTLIGGVLWLTVLAPLVGASFSLSELSPEVVGGVAYLAVCVTSITFFLTQRAIAVLGPAQTMAYTYCNPTLVLILVWCLGGASISPWALPGVGLTLAAMVWLRRASS